MKKVASMLMVLLISSSLFASKSGIGAHLGTVSFQKHYNDAITAGVVWSVATRSGLGYHFGISTLRATPTDGSPTLQMTPLTAELTYVASPKHDISPYFGAGVIVALLPSNFSSPSIGYGAKAGMRMRINRDSTVFLQLQKHLLYDSQNDININSHSLIAGLTLSLNEKPKKRMKPKPTHRRPQRRRKPARRYQLL